jgi:YegS/Rv2252/BmrU family lipid kinase
VRLALIANPRSGSAPADGGLEEALRARGAEVHRTAIGDLTGAEPGELDAARAAAGVRALRAGGEPDRVVVAGGDGSVGLAARLAGELGVPLAVVPAGTANDFARAVGIPLDVDDACALAADPEAATRPVELGEVGDRPFVNAASAGLSVLAARAARPHKPRLGPLAYAVGALKAAATASPVRCAIRVDGEERYDGAVWQVTVGVTGAFGGGSAIGGTRLDDGRLDVAVVPAGSRAGLARRALGMRTGRLTAQDDVTHLRGARVELDLPPGTAFNVDGEVCRCAPARFAVRPGAFSLVVP